MLEFRGEGEQLRQRRRRVRVDVVPLGEEAGAGRDARILSGKAAPIRIAISPIAAQLGQREAADGSRWKRGRRAEAAADDRVVKDDDLPVSGEMQIGFDGGDAEIEGDFKAGQSVLGLEAARRGGLAGRKGRTRAAILQGCGPGSNAPDRRALYCLETLRPTPLSCEGATLRRSVAPSISSSATCPAAGRR